MITIHASAEAVSRYRQLLVSDWGRTFPNDVLSLLWTTITSRTTHNGTEPLFQLLDPRHNTTFPSDFFQSIVGRISHGTRFVSVPQLSELSADYRPVKKLSAAVWQANRLAMYLTLPAHVAVTGNLQFFADAQALAFQAAMHVVLPELRARHEPEHALLLHAAVLFPLAYAAFDPAHYAYMMSMIHAYLGNDEARLEALYASFRFTSPRDHSYLTKAQEFWMELLDSQKPEQAEDFLFSLHWWSLPSQQDEVRKMMVQAFKETARQAKGVVP